MNKQNDGLMNGNEQKDEWTDIEVIKTRVNTCFKTRVFRKNPENTG